MSGKKQSPRGRGNVADKAAKPGRGSAPRGLAKWFSNIEDPTLRGAQINYYVVLGTTLALTFMGLIMVLSSSSVEAIAANKSPFADFQKQAMWAVVGLAFMVGLQILPTGKLKALAWPALVIASGLLAAVLVFGSETLGNTNWIYIGGFSMQPSEFAKAALVLWSAAIVERKAHLMNDWKHAVVPLAIPGGLVIIGLVMGGKDLGTALVLMLILVVVMFVGGAPLKLFAIGGGAVLVGLVVAVWVAPTRLGRVTAWLFGCAEGPPAAGTLDFCYQSQQGLYALASGGWIGVGLGQSRQKWSHIPEAQNDFIFAVLGEEMGLLGTLFIVLLYTMLAIAMFRIAVRSKTFFGRAAVAGVMAWIIGQAFVNIGMVIGLLPVIGVPLPFISSGGSALLATYLGIGVVLAFAREQRMGKKSAAPRGLRQVFKNAKAAQTK